MARFLRILPGKLALALISLLLPSQLWAGEQYFLIVFASQSTPIKAHATHTWATAVKVTTPSPCGWGPWVEAHTISWLPATLKVNTLAVLAEPGANLDLSTTLELALSHEQQISYWGPFAIDQELFVRCLQQKARLESGAMRYRAIDGIQTSQSRTVSNCIHAVTDATNETGRLSVDQLGRFGEAASEQVVVSLANRGRINPLQTHDWVTQVIGLAWYPAAQRQIAPLRADKR